MINIYFVGTVLNLASIYMIAGLGATISLASGAFNLGGEGQIYAGGFVAAMILSSSWCAKLPVFIGLIIAFAAAFFVSAALTIISGVLLRIRNADFLFTSFIVSAAVIPLIDGLISGPCRSHSDNLLATPFIAEKFRFLHIMPPSSLDISILFAPLLCILYWFIFNRTKNGRKLLIYGISRDFAEYAGINSKRVIHTTSIASGGLHGICGALAICGTYFTCHSGFYMSMGWNAFSTALIARANPLLLIPSSIFLAFITNASDLISMYNNLGFDLSSIIQAVLLFIIANLRRPVYVD